MHLPAFLVNRIYRNYSALSDLNIQSAGVSLNELPSWQAAVTTVRFLNERCQFYGVLSTTPGQTAPPPSCSLGLIEVARCVFC